jgi:hypothetical protein
VQPDENGSTSKRNTDSTNRSAAPTAPTVLQSAAGSADQKDALPSIAALTNVIDCTLKLYPQWSHHAPPLVNQKTNVKYLDLPPFFLP